MIKVFILNVGRSGSRSVATAYGFEHEPDGENPSIADVKSRSRGKLVYGETSHWWKAHLGNLYNAFGKSMTSWIHLVRNGRNVVRSFYSRGYYTDRPASDAAREELPPHNSSMSPFTKCCHYWNHWNRLIEHWTGNLIRLEDLVDIPHEHRSKDLEEWTTEMEEIFQSVCGPLQRRYGYE